jgi:hypothetical protein
VCSVGAVFRAALQRSLGPCVVQPGQASLGPNSMLQLQVALLSGCDSMRPGTAVFTVVLDACVDVFVLLTAPRMWPTAVHALSVSTSASILYYQAAEVKISAAVCSAASYSTAMCRRHAPHAIMQRTALVCTRASERALRNTCY